MQLLVTSHLLWISILTVSKTLEILKTVKIQIVVSLGGVKKWILFSRTIPHKILLMILIHEIELSGTSMESLIADCVKLLAFLLIFYTGKRDWALGYIWTQS